ncbi:MAG: hypothetical protein OEZ19_09785, partial [Paracoccaceae bacterium]|nr:hypothetical protein [Paracoccaceae bacterium]
VCIEDCVVYSLSETKVLELVVMDAGFGLFMTKLIAARMNDNLIAARAAHIRKFQEVPEHAAS